MLKALHPFVRRFGPYRDWLLAGWGLAVLTFLSSIGLLGLSGGFLTATALAGLIPATAPLFNVVVPAGGVRLLAITRTVGRWAERVVTHEATFRLIGDLRSWVYGLLSRISPRQLDQFHAGEALNRLTRDLDALDNVYLRWLLPTLSAWAVLISLTLISGFWAAGLVPLLVSWMALSLVVLPWAMTHLARNVTPALVRQQGQLRRRLLDVIDGLEEWSLHTPAWLKQAEGCRQADGERLALQERFGRLVARGKIVQGALTAFVGWGALAVLALLPAGSIEGPWLVASVLLILGAVEALQNLPAAWAELPGTSQAAERLKVLADQPPQPAFVPQGPALTDWTLEAEDLGFAYAEDPVLSQVSLRLDLGEHVLLTGPSGEGKSTLIKLLARLEDPQSGRLRLGSIPYRDLAESDFRAAVACAPQEPWALTATLADNLRLAAAKADEAELWQVLDVVGLAPAVRNWPLGLQTWVEEGGQSLSGGQQRRLTLARTLLRRAPITLLDEPTEGLSETEAEALVARIRQHLLGRSLVWVSHRAQGQAGFDRHWHLEKGRLAF